jgi:hypothetical protein
MLKKATLIGQTFHVGDKKAILIVQTCHVGDEKAILIGQTAKKTFSLVTLDMLGMRKPL